MKKTLPILIIAIIIAGGAGFYGGMQYQKGVKVSTAAGAARTGFTGARTGAGAGSARTGAGIANGQILAKTDTSLTIKLASGGSEIVFLAPSSQIMQSSTTTLSNLNVGQNVMVSGTTNSDGSVTARTVQVGDFRFGGPRPAGAGQGTSTNPAK
jgi:hypothetical protein